MSQLPKHKSPPPSPVQKMCDFPECSEMASFGFCTVAGSSWRQASPWIDAPAGATAFETETVWTCGTHRDAAPALAEARDAARRQVVTEREKPAQGSLL
jgi:hypothetical protein